MWHKRKKNAIGSASSQLRLRIYPIDPKAYLERWGNGWCYKQNQVIKGQFTKE